MGELMGKVGQERDIYQKMDGLKKSMDVMELDQAIAVLAKLRIKNADSEALTWRSNQMAIQMPIIKALQGVDTSQPFAEDDANTILGVKTILETCKQSGLGKEASAWVDPSVAGVFSAVEAAYNDVSTRIDAT